MPQFSSAAVDHRFMRMVASTLSNKALPRIMERFIDSTSSRDTAGFSNNCGSSSSSIIAVAIGGGNASFWHATTTDHARDKIAVLLRKGAFHVLMSEKDLESFQSLITINTHSNDVSTDVKVENETGDDGKNVQISGSETSISPGVMNSTLNDDVETVSMSLTMSVAKMLHSSSSVLLSMCHMVVSNSKSFLVSMTVVLLVGVAAMILCESIKRLTTKRFELQTKLASLAEERLRHASLVRSVNWQTSEIRQHKMLQRREAWH